MTWLSHAEEIMMIMLSRFDIIPQRERGEEWERGKGNDWGRRKRRRGKGMARGGKERRWMQGKGR